MDEVVEALEKYHGLVPLVYDIETMSLDEARSEDMPYAVYLKREADKVIAELDRVTDQKCDELRHSNYKRCLAMAKWCERKRIDAADYRIPREKWNFYDNWHTRWLEFAEKFKDKEV